LKAGLKSSLIIGKDDRISGRDNPPIFCRINYQCLAAYEILRIEIESGIVFSIPPGDDRGIILAHANRNRGSAAISRPTDIVQPIIIDPPLGIIDQILAVQDYQIKAWCQINCGIPSQVY